MAKFTLTIECDNSAFEPLSPEIRRIVGTVLDDLDFILGVGGGRMKLRDYNGNTVGLAEFSE